MKTSNFESKSDCLLDNNDLLFSRFQENVLQKQALENMYSMTNM